MSSIVLMIKSEGTGAVNKQFYQFETGKPKEQAKALENLFRKVGSGAKRCVLDVGVSSSDPVAAFATATLVSCATDTITIGGITLTGAASPVGNTQFNTSGSDTADAAALAACINAHPTLKTVFAATSTTNVTRITMRVKGVVGNLMGISRTGTTITLAAFSGGTGGIDEAPFTYNFGIT